MYEVTKEAQEFFTALGREHIAVAGIVGTYRKGKSTFMNLLVDGKSPSKFGVSSGAKSYTKGIEFWCGKTEAGCPNYNTVFLDVEGSDAPTGVDQKWKEYALNAVALLLSSVLFYWHWEGTISSNLGIFTSLLLFSSRLRHSLEEGEITASDLSLPSLYWLCRDWDQTGMDFDPSNEYVLEQMEMVDKTLIPHVNNFKQFSVLKLIKPVAGPPIPKSFEHILPEYMDILTDIRNKLKQQLSPRWTASGFLTMCHSVLSIINTDDFVPDLWTSACKQANQRMASDCVQQCVHDYIGGMDKLALPAREHVFEEYEATILTGIYANFSSTLAGFVSEDDQQELAITLKAQLSKKRELYSSNNIVRSTTACHEAMSALVKSYTKLLQGKMLPLSTKKVHHICKETQAIIIDKFQTETTALGTVIKDVAKKLEDELEASSSRWETDNDMKSEVVCRDVVIPCMQSFKDSLQHLTTPMDPNALRALFKEAAAHMTEQFNKQTTNTSTKIHNQYLGQLTTESTQLYDNIQKENRQQCKEYLDQLLPKSIRNYKQLMSDPLKVAVDHEAMKQIHFSALEKTTLLWNESVIGDKEMKDSYKRALLEQLTVEQQRFVQSNDDKSEEYCQKLIQTAYSIYDKNMKLVSWPAYKDEFEATHAENESWALQHYKDKCIGPEKVVERWFSRLKELVQLSYKHYATENEPRDMDCVILRRSEVLHTWKARRISMKVDQKKLFFHTEQGQLRDSHDFQDVLSGKVYSGGHIKLPKDPTWSYCMKIEFRKSQMYICFNSAEERNTWIVFLANLLADVHPRKQSGGATQDPGGGLFPPDFSQSGGY